ncbi:MAG: LamG-like jellyroll fold domain-containing protein, partial [Bradymonadaceae bacterium]
MATILWISSCHTTEAEDSGQAFDLDAGHPHDPAEVDANQSAAQAPERLEEMRSRVFALSTCTSDPECEDGDDCTDNTCEPGSWAELAASNTGLPAVAYHAMVYDSARGRVVLFGGEVEGVDSQETWEWDGASWTRVATTGPPARNRHAMAYDAARGRVVLFGGLVNDTRVDDTWEFDGVTATWTRRSPATAPIPRHFHAMTYDTVQERVLLYGGRFGVFQNNRSGETWEWNGTTETWTMVSNTGPPGRENHAMTFDSDRGVAVMFGGDSLAGVLDDTWEWDGATRTWANRMVTGPGPRNNHGLAFDSARNRTVLFGGFHDVAGYPEDTWEWDGTSWELVAPDGPTGRSRLGLVFDATRGETVLAGGRADAVVSSDTWGWAGPEARCMSVDNGTCCVTDDFCDDLDPCTVNTCDINRDCQTTDAPTGTSCEDGYCNAGECEECTNDAHCPNDGNACTMGVCDLTSWTCTMADTAPGTTCPEGYCYGGECFECFDDAHCPDDGNACTVSACNLTTNLCETTDVPTSTSCGAGYCEAGECHECTESTHCADDGDRCTDMECNANTCEGVDNATCECRLDSQCDDLDSCTQNLCDDGNCVHPPTGACCEVDGDCDDSNACTVNLCQDGLCTYPASTHCDDLDRCTSNICNPDGSSSNPETGECCTTDAGCGDGNACTVNTCDGNRDCQVADAAPGATCPGGYCDTGVCYQCFEDSHCPDDGNNCTNTRCNLGTNTCESYDNETCECEFDVQCDDNDRCTDNTCELDNTCSASNNDVCCSLDIHCTDSNPCTVNSCDVTTGDCSTAPAADGTSCPGGGYCGAGACRDCTQDSHCPEDDNICTRNRCNLGSYTCETVDSGICECESDDECNTDAWYADGTSYPCCSEAPGRIEDGLAVLYTFAERSSSTILDHSGHEEPLDLQIADSTVEWIAHRNGVRFSFGGRVSSILPPTRLRDQILASNEFTVEAWIRPANLTQTGPARIVSYSSGTSERNFTLGQDGTRLDVRRRGENTDLQGQPAVVSTESLTLATQHVVFTFDGTTLEIRRDGVLVGSNTRVEDFMSNWDESFLLHLGNDGDGSRPWAGEMYLMAIYDRALSAEEVVENYNAGDSFESRSCVCQDEEFRDFACVNNACGHTVTDNRTVKSDCASCNDGDSCTQNLCSEGVCANPLNEGDWPCADADTLETDHLFLVASCPVFNPDTGLGNDPNDPTNPQAYRFPFDRGAQTCQISVRNKTATTLSGVSVSMAFPSHSWQVVDPVELPDGDLMRYYQTGATVHDVTTSMLRSTPGPALEYPVGTWNGAENTYHWTIDDLAPGAMRELRLNIAPTCLAPGENEYDIAMVVEADYLGQTAQQIIPTFYRSVGTGIRTASLLPAGGLLPGEPFVAVHRLYPSGSTTRYRLNPNTHFYAYLPYFDAGSGEFYADDNFDAGNPNHQPVFDPTTFEGTLQLLNPNATIELAAGEVTAPAAGFNAGSIIHFEVAKKRVKMFMGEQPRCGSSTGESYFTYEAMPNVAIPDGAIVPIRTCYSSDRTRTGGGAGMVCTSAEVVMNDPLWDGEPAISYTGSGQAESTAMAPTSTNTAAYPYFTNLGTVDMGPADYYVQIPGDFEKKAHFNWASWDLFNTNSDTFDLADGYAIYVSTVPTDYGSEANLLDRDVPRATGADWVRCDNAGGAPTTTCTLANLTTLGIAPEDVHELRFHMPKFLPYLITHPSQKSDRTQARFTLDRTARGSIDGSVYDSADMTQASVGAKFVLDYTVSGTPRRAEGSSNWEVNRSSVRTTFRACHDAYNQLVNVGDTVSLWITSSCTAPTTGFRNIGGLDNIFGPFDISTTLPEGFAYDNSAFYPLEPERPRVFAVYRVGPPLEWSGPMVYAYNSTTRQLNVTLDVDNVDNVLFPATRAWTPEDEPVGFYIELQGEVLFGAPRDMRTTGTFATMDLENGAGVRGPAQLGPLAGNEAHYIVNLPPSLDFTATVTPDEIYS